MLKMANVTKNDVVYDLGCGDGKIVIAAGQASARAASASTSIRSASRKPPPTSKAAGVTDRVQFILGDIFDPTIKISEATVVTLYLLPTLNVQAPCRG